MPAEPEPDLGPDLVIVVVNESDTELGVAYEFQAGTTEGGGETPVTACSRQTLAFGQVAGAYRVLLDAEPIFDSEIPPETPRDGFWVVQLAIDPDGVASIAEPRWTRFPPDIANQVLFDCGQD